MVLPSVTTCRELDATTTLAHEHAYLFFIYFSRKNLCFLLNFWGFSQFYDFFVFLDYCSRSNHKVYLAIMYVKPVMTSADRDVT